MGRVWLGRYEGFDSEAAACYSDGKVWLGRYKGFDSEAAACYSDGKVWLGRYEGFDSEVAARYDGSDEGAAAAVFILLFFDGDSEYEESSSSNEETTYESFDSSPDNSYSSHYGSSGGSSESSSSGSFWIWLIVLAVGLPIGALFNHLNDDRQTKSLNTPSLTQAPPPPPKYITGVGADGTQYYSDGTTSTGGLQGTISETAVAPQIRPEEVITIAPPQLPTMVANFLARNGLRIPATISKYCESPNFHFSRENHPYFVRGDFDGDGETDYAVDVEDRDRRDIFVFFGNGSIQKLDGWDFISLNTERGTLQTMDGPVQLEHDSIRGIRCESSAVLYVFDVQKNQFAKFFTSD